jgi:hypothetical protein
MKLFTIVLFLFVSISAGAQELYVFSEPASNMPAHSLSLKETVRGLRNRMGGDNESRYITELMFGVNKNLMLHGSTSFSNMYSNGMQWESARLYGKYRFFSNDGLHSHLRLSAFAEGAVSRNKAYYDELSMDGDQSGVQAGIIATQLLHKLAISSSVSLIEVLQESRWDKTVPPIAPYQAVNYTLSAGYLVLPKAYTNYNQTNLNLYIELLGQNTTDIKRHYIDLAPAAQLIFNSEAKLNLGYRFQLDGNMNRMSDKSWLISFEWLFLNAF